MCFKRKKYTKKIGKESKFHIGDAVRYHYKGELEFGYVYDIDFNNKENTYVIQLGGQCPFIRYDIKESELNFK